MADEACGCDLSCDLPDAARSDRAAEIREALLSGAEIWALLLAEES